VTTISCKLFIFVSIFEKRFNYFVQWKMGRRYKLSDNPLTRQGVLCQSRRQGDSPRVIDNPLTCQGALCNQSERQGDNPHVINNPLTCQGALCNRSERQGDSRRVIDNPLTCQGALCNQRERQGDSQHAIDTDLDHRSITMVQNHDLLKESNEQSYEQIDIHHATPSENMLQ
jgi:hypothetical protein